MDNLLFLTDSYKVSHYKQYPPGTEKIYSYFESRGGRYRETVFFGLQYFIKKYLLGQVVTEEKIAEAEEFYGKHLSNKDPVNISGWRHILETHGGRLPVRIKAVAEGTPVSTNNVLMTIENTDSGCFWLTNYLETLLVQVWYPSTVATRSRQMKKTILAALKKSGTPEEIDFKLHDFGCRGASSMESAALGGAAHLVNFQGTDTVLGAVMLRKYYGADMAGFSIPAAEHSTITSWGENHEVDAFKNMLTQFDEGLVAVVSDSWDLYRACRHHWGKTLKEDVLKRNGLLVIRPDSGDPKEILPEMLRILGNQFGTSHTRVNGRDYMMVDAPVRIIQGDGIKEDTIGPILDAVMDAGWSADMLAFGSGGGLLQSDIDRDTSKYAFKCAWAQVNNKGRDVYKEPATGSWKRSKRGRLGLVLNPKLLHHHNSPWTTMSETDAGADNLLDTVFENGELVKEFDLATIRANAAI